MTLVVKLEKGRTVRVVIFEVDIMHFWFACSVSTFFANIDLRPSLLVRVLVLHSVNFQTMRLQTAPLCKRLLAHITFVGPHTRVSSGVSLEVKSIVESFTTEGTQVSFNI